MNKQKLTPWFDGDVRPARPGLYERQHRPGLHTYSYWNGSFWGYSCGSRRDALALSEIKSIMQSVPWRGIAKDKRMSDKMREEFEKWAISESYSTKRFGAYNEEFGTEPVYGPKEQCGWRAWQAATKAQQAQIDAAMADAAKEDKR